MAGNNHTTAEADHEIRDYDAIVHEATSTDQKSSEKTPVESVEVESTEYACGFKLIAIVLALLLTVFLFALDMVTDSIHDASGR